MIHSFKIGRYLMDLYDENTHYRRNYCNVQKIVKLTNYLQNDAICYICIFLATGYLVVEFEKCEDTSNDYACGFIFPNVRRKHNEVMFNINESLGVTKKVATYSTA